MAETEAQKKAYLLGRSPAASVRLTSQHFLWKTAFGYNIHPSVIDHWRTAEGKEGKKIADIACGNAVWVMDECHSQIAIEQGFHFSGFDITTALFPPAAAVPTNVTLGTYDIFQEPPAELQASFDLIDIRLVISVIGSKDPRPLVRRLAAMLKPGGYLQWCETDPMNARSFPASRETCEIYDRFLRVVAGPNNADGSHAWEWTRKLAAIFEETGLFDVVHEEHKSEIPPEFVKYWSDNTVSVYSEAVRASGRQELMDAFEETEKMRMQGYMAYHDLYMIVGRKKAV